ncbi:MAG: hypothetical protein RL748_3117 [Pseudomonadota bacterium]|jgi:hypothetical protein
MKHSKLLSLLLLSSFAVAAPNEVALSNGIEIGSVDAVIQGFATQHANPQSKFVRTLGAQTIAANIRDYFYRDGKLSISGTALDSKNSVFMLKGSQKSLYGYMVLHDSKKAYEYTTDAAGKVWVKEVAISKIYPDFDDKFIKSNVPPQGLLLATHPVYSPLAVRQAPHIGPYNNQDLTKLESRPGSPYVFYLNTTAVMSGTTPLNGVTKENMYRAWQSIADQYSMLQLNVTTNRAVYDAAKSANVLRTGIINFINQDGRSFAPVHSFGTTSAGTLYRNPSSGFDYGYGIGMTGAHEVGHQMGMLHDGGGSGGEYFEGIAAYQWGPIMGNYWQGGGWANQLFTWSRGEYNTASNREDDLKIMTVDEAVPYVADDNASGKALVVGSNGAVEPTSNWGQIERNSDSDSFTFTLGAAGSVSLRIDPIEYLRMLDVEASIVNSAGTVVASSNKAVHRSAEFTNLSLPAGSYRLVIKGGAEGTPANGFSSYSSLGYYAIKGTIGGSVVEPPPGDPVLSSGVPVTAQSAAAGQWKYFVIDVPAGNSSVKFAISGNNGDADLFAQLGSRPTTSAYKCKSDGPSSVESCTVSAPAAGKYYLGVQAYSAYSNLSVTATITK